MKLCVFGAGAIGGHLAVLLARAGVEVSLVARGPHLAAIKANGLTLIEQSGERETIELPASDDPADLGVQDYVLVALKAHSVPPIVERMAPLIGPDTAVVTAVNGIPWWYFHNHGGAFDGRQIESVDPGGKQWSMLGPERAIGCVVWQAAEIVEPGVIRHEYGTRMPLGEPDGSRSDRAQALSKALIAGGMRSPVRPRIRDEIWMKLWGNLSFNPISLLTHSTLKTLATDAGCRASVAALMREGKAVAEALGIKFPMDVEQRIDGAAEVGEHKTSMLVDLETARPIELDALVGAVIELGRLVEVPTPSLELVYHLTRQRAREAGCYPEPNA
ncbi:MAG: 2-dehydropantoate 2-reductase [Alphaproteobacteria bacterium]